MKASMLVLLAVMVPLQVRAQHFVTAGAGFGTIIVSSSALDRFTETYNLVNSSALSTFLKGFAAGFNLQWEAGYRYAGRFSKAVTAGWQAYRSRDVAEFGNGEVRNLELQIKSLSASGELGYGWREFFVNGLATFYFNRKTSITSELAQAGTVRSALTGTYTSAAAVAMDAGIALGLFRNPIFLLAKITYPVHTGGTSEKLEDRDPAKIAEGLSLFPDDYIKFVNREPYAGVGSDIDGLKITIMIAFAFRR